MSGKDARRILLYVFFGKVPFSTKKKGTVSVLRVIQKCMQNGTRYTVLKPKVGKAPMGMDGWWWCFYYRNPNPDVCRSNTRNFLKS